jgi:hypothetical protein
VTEVDSEVTEVDSEVIEVDSEVIEGMVVTGEGSEETEVAVVGLEVIEAGTEVVAETEEASVAIEAGLEAVSRASVVTTGVGGAVAVEVSEVVMTLEEVVAAAASEGVVEVVSVTMAEGSTNLRLQTGMVAHLVVALADKEAEEGMEDHRVEVVGIVVTSNAKAQADTMTGIRSDLGTKLPSVFPFP